MPPAFWGSKGIDWLNEALPEDEVQKPTRYLV